MALICNLVQEFNGLVSKGSAAMLALLLCINPSKISEQFFVFATHTPHVYFAINFLLIFMFPVKFFA